MHTDRTTLNCSLLLITLLVVGCSDPPSSNTPPEKAVAPITSVAVSGNESPSPAAHGSGVQVPAALALASETEVAEVPASKIVRELVIDQPATFYFHSGKHYRPPFRLIQTQYELILRSDSGSRIARQFPVIPEDYPAVFPALPKGITAQSSWQELDKLRLQFTLFNEVRFYFACRYKTPEAAEKFTEYVKSLPFVKTVAWSDATGKEGTYDPAKKQYLRVVSHAGDERHLFTDWWDPQVRKDWRPGDFELQLFGFPDTEFLIPNSPERLAKIKKELDRGWKSLEETLSDGSIYIFDDKTFVRDRLREPAVETLAQIGVILQKKDTKQQRSTEIVRLLLLLDNEKADWDPRLQVVIEYFDHSVEMQDWIKSVQALNAERVRKESHDRGTP